MQSLRKEGVLQATALKWTFHEILCSKKKGYAPSARSASPCCILLEHLAVPNVTPDDQGSLTDKRFDGMLWDYYLSLMLQAVLKRRDNIICQHPFLKHVNSLSYAI
ncbi:MULTISPECIES: hypothetical protein [unclassified Pseudomonas]|uniref:hypothetical protein n=1 Tax=unclassified Pseudomonas TaxID=196821 RepID=UPI0011137620|nr:MULTISPECIES: hypothetical protein [unclassified Pseudomonas]